MNANHTPGPWHVSKRNPLRVIESGPRGNSIARMGINLGVCSQEEAEANTRLIAAAPELLAALRRLSAAALARDTTMGDQCGLFAAQAELRDANKQACAAIAKATGSSA